MENTFGVADYVVFIVFLVLSIAVGMYFACTGGKQKSKQEFIMGDRKLHLIPVALSMAATWLSPIFMIGQPAEVYMLGPSIMLISFAQCMSCILSSIFFVPLLYPLKLTSAYAYLELRFGSPYPKFAATMISIIGGVFLGGVAVYASAMALQPVTGIKPWVIMMVISLVSSIYSAMGGLKAVVWVDALQSFVMLAGILALVIGGILRVGSLSNVFKINEEHDHSTVFYSNPLFVYSYWNVLFGATLGLLAKVGVHQTVVQRYSSLSTLKKAQYTTFLTGIFLMIPGLLLTLTGYVMFAYYEQKGCDPLLSKQVTSPNHLVSYFVMEILAYPGVPGLFIASICCAVLSSISSYQSASAAVVWEDFLKNIPYFKKSTEAVKVYWLKGLVVAFGGASFLFGMVVLAIPGTTLFKLTLSFVGATNGPLLGMFLLGSLFPFTHWKGAISGCIVGLILPMWISFGSLFNPLPGNQSGYVPISVSTSNCKLASNLTTYNTSTRAPGYDMWTTTADTTTPSNTTMAEDNGFTMATFYATIPYVWYGLIGWLTTVLVGVLVSLCTGKAESKVEKKYLMPCLRKWFGVNSEDIKPLPENNCVSLEDIHMESADVKQIKQSK